MRTLRITEERASVAEISYDVIVDDDVDIDSDDFEIEDHLDRAADEVHRHTLRSNYEITNVEELS